jgi:hypothetical protein
MIVVAIIGILAAVIVPVLRDQQEQNVIGLEEPPSLDGIPTTYIDNDRRSQMPATLQRHSDGSLWACVNDAACYEVR